MPLSRGSTPLVEPAPGPRTGIPRPAVGSKSVSSTDSNNPKPGTGLSAFPARRMRRLRRTPALRRLVAETRLSVDDLVAPLFVREGIAEPVPIASMPGQSQHTIDSLVAEAKRLVSLGVPGLILFGVPATKDAAGTEAYSPDGIVQRALHALRDAVGAQLCL